jgi:hypothetical protein
LRCEKSLCRIAMSLAFAILFVGVLHGDFLVGKELAVHVRDGFVRGLEVGEGDEAVAFGDVCLVACDLLPFMLDHAHMHLRGHERRTFGGTTNVPNLENVSYSVFSSTSASRLPINSSAPTSTVFCLSALALFTRIGLPYNRT